jgi:DNA-binding transcriptional LysR family regulator
MDRLDAITAFVAAVDEGSLAAAARRLKLSPASISRAITALEARLGTALLHRTARSLQLTEAGRDYLATSRLVLAELEAADRGVAARTALPRGLLTITAPPIFGRRVVRPIVDDFLDTHPAVQARLILADRLLDLVDEGVDIAIRIAFLPDSTLIARQVGQVQWVVCAAPSYLEAHGTPHEPADLSNHRCITPYQASWGFTTDRTDEHAPLRHVHVRARLSVNGQAPAIDSTVAGHGITRVMSFSIRRELESGLLVPLLTAFTPRSLPVQIVAMRDLLATVKVRAFVDHAVPALAAELSATALALGVTG